MLLVKNFFDYTIAAILLIALGPIILILIVLSSISTNRFGIFTQERVGKNGRIFNIYKIRSMHTQDEEGSITSSNDVRITSLGRFLRSTKLDELPQIVNVLKGDMSFVGPRPDVIGYADRLRGDDRIILNVKPGITGPATIKFKDEEDILALQSDKQKYNDEVIWPEKVRINKKYVKDWSLWTDFKVLLKTFG